MVIATEGLLTGDDHSNQTKAGSIPSDWKVAKVSQLAELITGPFGTLLAASEYDVHDGIPMISVGEIRQGYIQLHDTTPLIPKSVQIRLPQYILRKDDIVFGRKGGVDRSARITEHEAGWFLGSDGICLRARSDVFAEYLAHQFRSAKIQNWLLDQSVGTTMPSLNQSILGALEVPLPPIAEQEAIAEALSDADEAIRAVERLLAKKRAVKQATLQTLLSGQIRLPGFEAEWETKQLGEIAECFSGGTPATSDSTNYGGSISWITSTSLNAKIIRFVPETISSKGLITSSARMVSRGTILVAMYGATAGVVARSEIDGAINQAILAVKPHTGYSEYIFHTLEREALLAVDRLAQGGQANLSGALLKQLSLNFPAVPEQKAITLVLSDMDVEIEAVGVRLSKLRAIKQGMMQELLTGRTRLV